MKAAETGGAEKGPNDGFEKLIGDWSRGEGAGPNAAAGGSPKLDQARQGGLRGAWGPKKRRLGPPAAPQARRAAAPRIRTDPCVVLTPGSRY
jgi:hypothetical protein